MWRHPAECIDVAPFCLVHGHKPFSHPPLVQTVLLCHGLSGMLPPSATSFFFFIDSESPEGCRSAKLRRCFGKRIALLGIDEAPKTAKEITMEQKKHVCRLAFNKLSCDAGVHPAGPQLSERQITCCFPYSHLWQSLRLSCVQRELTKVELQRWNVE